MTDDKNNLVQNELKPRDPRALNSYRHGLTGQVLIVTPGDEAAYHRHCENIKKALAPEGAFEAGLVQSIADDQWRLFRAASLDINTRAVSTSAPGKIISEHLPVQTALAQAAAWATDSKNMNMLCLYEGRIQRRLERNVKMLQEARQQPAQSGDSGQAGRKPNTTPGRKVNTVGANRCRILDFPRAVRPRQDKPSGAKRRLAATSEDEGAGQGVAVPCPAPALEKPSESRPRVSYLQRKRLSS